MLLAAALSACAQGERVATRDPALGVPTSPRVIPEGQPIPRGGGVYKLGIPYSVAGLWYVPREDRAYDRMGVASWYGRDFHGRRTANGEIFDRNRLSAAHPTLPLPCYVTVTNLTNGRTILVRVNDRGPYARGRLIDLSPRASLELGIYAHGTAPVRVRYAGHAPLSGDDRREWQFLAAQPWFAAGRRLAGGASPGVYGSLR